MDFVVLSLPEASYLYMGLAIQALVRQSSLRWLPGVIVLVWTLVLLGRAGLRAAGSQYRSLLGYLGASLVILVLFWPEAVPFGRLTDTTEASRIASYSAMHDVDAEVITAEDTGDVPTTLHDPTLLAPGFRLLLRAITETPLALARTINSKAHRTFASLLPMQWLLTQELTADAVGAVGDWVHNCLLPAKTLLMQAGGGQTYQDLLPWDGSALRAELGRRQVTPGAQTGIQWLRAADSGTTVRCDVYLDAVELRVQRWLADAEDRTWHAAARRVSAGIRALAAGPGAVSGLPRDAAGGGTGCPGAESHGAVWAAAGGLGGWQPARWGR